MEERTRGKKLLSAEVRRERRKRKLVDTSGVNRSGGDVTRELKEKGEAHQI